MPITRAYGQASQLGNTPAASNPIINGGMDIWQRGTTFTNCSSVYVADRWYSFTNGVTTGRTITRQTTGDTTNLPNIQYCIRVGRDSGNTNTLGITLSQPMETVDSIAFAGKTVTFSFYARRGANYSAASNSLGVYLVTGTGTDQNQQASGYTGTALPVNSTATLTTTWQRFTFTATIAQTATEICPVFVHIPVGTAGAADYFEITGVQIDIGSVALPFRRAMNTLAGELAACQRYYEKSYSQATAPGTSSSSGFIGGLFSTAVGTDNNNYYMNYFPFKVVKRSSPTITIYDNAGNSGKTTAMALNSAGTNNITSYVSDIVDSAARVYVGQLDGKAGFIFHYVASAEL